MVFLKPIEDLRFSDIERLKIDEICESQILDYKEQLLEDNKLLKQVSAFANTQGGFLIFGVKESGKGGYPKEILGLDKSEVNKERMEQIILGNIQPRVNVKIYAIDHRDPTKAVVVIQVPDSYLKPHMNSRDGKFYKRYQFEASPMTELEVSDTYRRRFIGYQEVESYISKTLPYPFGEGEVLITPHIIGQIIVIPTILRRIIDTYDVEDFKWMSKLEFKPNLFSIFRHLRRNSPVPSRNGIKLESRKEGHVSERLEIHRNGCVHSASYFGRMIEKKMLLDSLDLSVAILHTLQFASTAYRRYNYFGDVKVVCNLETTRVTWLRIPDALMRRFGLYEDYLCRVSSIMIARELPTNVVESSYERITSRIMDEIFNSYGLWKCPLFDEKGNFNKESLR